MAKVNFYLDKPLSKKETQIFMYFSYHGKRFSFYTGQKVHPKNWDSKKQIAKGTNNPFHIELNLLLDEFKNTINATYARMVRTKEIITNAKLKKPLLDIKNYSVENQSEQFNLLTWFDHWYENRESSGEHSKDVLKGFRSRIKLMKEFFSNNPNEFDDLNPKLVMKFRKFIINKNYSSNYGNVVIKNFKTIVNEAIDDGHTNNTTWRTKRFFIPTESIHAVYFSIDQLLKLYYHDFESERLERVRDAFLIDCFTGVRFSDAVSLHRDNIILRGEQKVFAVNTKKGKVRAYIPIHPMVEFILDKYDGSLPPRISDVKMNKYLKEVAREAGFDEPIYIVRTIGGKRKEEKFATWEKVSTHTARRSLATNLHLANVPPKSAMLVTGHKSIKQYMDYIKIDSEQNAVLLSQSDFYNMKLKRV